MKRSSSAPNLEKFNVKTKKLKPNEEKSVHNSQEYLQLVLARIIELQRQISDGVYITEETSDIDGSDSNENIMNEVLTKVFKNLPESPKTITAIINSTSKPSMSQLKTIQNKSIQLAGFEVCRNVAVNFLKNINQLPPLESVSDDVQKIYNIKVTEFEARKRMLGSLDLHLAAKQRDYTARLMRE